MDAFIVFVSLQTLGPSLVYMFYLQLLEHIFFNLMTFN
jgi:hypothetical protein